MIINWFSPLAPMPSDIGHFSLRVRSELERRTELRVFPDVADCPGAHEQRASRDAGAQMLNEADFDVYNFGNNVDFHADAWILSLARGGLAILHDLSYQHFFGMLFLERKGRPDVYSAVMQAYYGKRGRDAARARIEGTASAIELAAEFPLTALAASGACDVVHHYGSELPECDRIPGSCRFVPLPYACSDVSPDRALERKRIRKRRRIVMFGYMGENRRIDLVLKALARVSCKARIRLDIYGLVPRALGIDGLVSELGLGRTVKVHGFVGEKELDVALLDADLAINLRNPSMGEASGSQLRIWDNCLSSLVTNHMWYATLPPGTVFPVDPADEEQELVRHMEQLVADPEPYWEAGMRGRRALEENHAPDEYVGRLWEILARSRPRRALSAMDPTLASMLTHEFPWWQGRANDPVLARSREVARSVLGSSATAIDGSS